MQTIDEILNAIKEKRLNVSDISRKTSIPGTRIYKWLDNKGKPKGPDSEKLRIWAINNLELLPENGNITSEKPNEHGQFIAGLVQYGGGKEPSAMQILSVLAEAFRDQAALMKSIEGKMAQQVDQLAIKEKVQATEARTKEIYEIFTTVRKDLTTLKERQELEIEEFRESFAKLGAERTLASRPVHKK